MTRGPSLSFLCGVAFAALPLAVAYQWSSDERSVPVNQELSPITHPASEQADNQRSLVSEFKAKSKDARTLLVFLLSLDAEQVTTLLQAQDMSQLAAPVIALFERMAELDFDAAFTFAETKVPLPQRLELLEGLLFQLAVKDPDTCQEWIDRSGVEMEIEALDQWELFLREHAELRASYPATEREIAREWRALFAAPKINGCLYSTSLELRFDQQPIAKLYPILNYADRNHAWKATLEKLITIPDPGPFVLSPIVESWREEDLGGALDWAEALPEGDVRRDVIRALANPGRNSEVNFLELYEGLNKISPNKARAYADRWVEHDPEAVAKWILENDVPPIEVSDFAIELAAHDLDAALMIALASEKERGNLDNSYALFKILDRWSWSEPWAAAAWARENLGWSEEKTREKLK